MGLFSSSTEKSTLARNPVNPDITTQSGSGAEQDRYGAHFSVPKDALSKGVDKLRDAALTKGEGAEQDRYNEHLGVGNRGYDKLKDAAKYRGDGAEQDRYNTHFSPALHSLDAQKVKHAAQSIVTKGNAASYHGLGYDGQQRAKLLAGSGTGAEQDRYGSRFGLSQDTVASAAQKVKDGAKDVLERR
ncbi:uncharacterized protein K460DRAFT_394650 [Cucurbitaria berberidis CBS 394.84]|uniref:Uncharacterized protein n=1 Tax=Cucurbitaria berberidis CBS 394.84 TaxID=1168544 RepID=A0A9P4GGL2_9PLEO|nr:uncharacterized protein K460DRAFT_394650 [Cucurbitaria berberidis CBS 394.84]KAF1844854.1 hypothetical protein K460DRAFT_394650 [Cucurbitaria berberidis CBS 394.84]